MSALETEVDQGVDDDDSDSSEISIRTSLQDGKSSILPDLQASNLESIAPGDSIDNDDDGNIEGGAGERSHNTGSDCSCTTNGGILLEQILFFLAGLGSSIGYISTLSSLVYFKILFGANSFVYLNCAVFLPLLPISLAQAIWDARFDLLYQSRVTFLFRGIIGYAFTISGTLGMVSFARIEHGDSDDDSQNHEGKIGWVIVHALQQGIGGAVLFGQLNQLASFVGSIHHNNNTDSHNFEADNNELSDENEVLPRKFKATVSAGVQASALVVLLASIFSGFGTMNGVFFVSFLSCILKVEIFCLVAFLSLLVARPRIQVSMLRRDASMRELTRYSSNLEEFQQLWPSSAAWESSGDFDPSTTSDDNEPARMRLPLLLTPPSPDGSGGEQSTMLTLKDLLYHSRLACLGMALTLVPSFLVGSWFTRVQTDWMELAQILFYVRIGSDLAGRFATILIPPPSIQCAVWIAGLRIVPVAVFFANSGSKIPIRVPFYRDALSICMVALVAFCSGYLVTSFYQLAPQQLPGTARVRAANAAKQSSLLTVAFSVSAIGGLVMSFVLVAAGL